MLLRVQLAPGNLLLDLVDFTLALLYHSALLLLGNVVLLLVVFVLCHLELVDVALLDLLRLALQILLHLRSCCFLTLIIIFVGEQPLLLNQYNQRLLIILFLQLLCAFCYTIVFFFLLFPVFEMVLLSSLLLFFGVATGHTLFGPELYDVFGLLRQAVLNVCQALRRCRC